MTTRSRPQQRRKNESPANADAFPLGEEIATYDAHLSGWADREGKFVLIKDRDVLGFYKHHEEALEAGYSQLGGGPFLVKQIRAHEPIYQLGRIEL
jgi:hypothetical protein